MKFEDIKTGKSVSIIGYHWTDNSSFKPKNGILFFCDEYKTWYSDVITLYLITMNIKLKNPFVMDFMDKNQNIEGFLNKNRKFLSLLKRNKYDSLIWVPKKGSIAGSRQGILLYPKNQIKSYKIENLIKL